MHLKEKFEDGKRNGYKDKKPTTIIFVLWRICVNISKSAPSYRSSSTLNQRLSLGLITYKLRDKYKNTHPIAIVLYKSNFNWSVIAREQWKLIGGACKELNLWPNGFIIPLAKFATHVYQFPWLTLLEIL